MRISTGALSKWAAIALVVVLPMGLAAEALFSGGPLDAKTGAPGEGLCTECHGSASGNGLLEILGVSGPYTPAATYLITVRLQDPGQQRWGFELTAIDAAGNGAGTFTITDPTNTQLSDTNSNVRDYVKHRSAGTFAGTPDGPVTWQFEWNAPTGVGKVTFYAAGNAANNNNLPTGDFIYTANSSIYICGDANNSGGVDIDDVVFLIAYIFQGGPAPDPVDAGDANCSGGVDIDDVVYVISFIFQGGAPPCDTDNNGSFDC